MSRVVHSVVVCGIALLGLLVVYMGGNWRDGSGRQARGGGGSSSHIRKITQRRRRLQASGSPSSIPSDCNGMCRSQDWYADGVCDMECFSEECGWDGADCAGMPRINAYQQQQTQDGTNRRDRRRRMQVGSNSVVIPETCFGDCRDLEWFNDTVCDFECYNYACEFDGGDCEPGLECTDLASYCKWNETCQSQDDGFGRCESLCSTIECSEEENEVCEVQRIPEGEPGAGSGVGKCVCAENYVRGDNDECFQVRDCAVGEWKDWGECSKSCEGGVKKRTREVTAEPQGGGEECPELEETAPCNEQPCPVACVVGDWSIWSPCSKDCGGGKRRRGREITTEPQHDGEECPPLSEEEDCNTEPCKTDCTVSDWSGWDKCSEECGGGTQSRTRTVVEPDQSGGAPCPELSEERACNEDPCAVDCKVGGWGNFSECSKSCGGGSRTRNRTVEVEPSDDGEQCPDLEETEECNTQPCDPCAGLSCGLNEECRRSSDNTTATCKCTPPFTRASPEAECMNMQQQQQQQPAVGIPRPVSAESDQQQQGPVGIPSIPSGCNGNCRSMNWFNDTVCDMECFTEECSWDGDDCASEPRMNANQQTENETNRRDIPETCVGDCRDLEWVNDSVCDLTCYNYACGFDGGDCDPGVECTDLASYCKWNETCQSQDDGFGRCESLCSTIECSEDRNEVCEVQRIPEGEPGAGSGVGKCVCAENYVRGDNDECLTSSIQPVPDEFFTFGPFCDGDRPSTVRCTSGSTMDILDAFYGRVANVPECPSDSGVTDCGSPSGLLQKLKDQCDGQGSCTVKADPEELGDECPGVEKYLTIDFRCN